MRKAIVKEMTRQGVSEYQLAKLSGVPQTTVNRFCRGDGDARSDSVAKMLRILSKRAGRRTLSWVRSSDLTTG